MGSAFPRVQRSHASPACSPWLGLPRDKARWALALPRGLAASCGSTGLQREEWQGPGTLAPAAGAGAVEESDVEI